MKYLSALILPLILFSSLIEAGKVINDNDCETKLIQMMKPQYPKTNYQDFEIDGFMTREELMESLVN
jgi:hypothetical protein